MGCVNCKSTMKRSSPTSSSRGSEQPSRAQKTVEKRQRKSVRSLLRALLFAKKSRSTSKISPEPCSSIQTDSSSPNTSSRSAKSLHEIFSGNPTNCFCEEEIPIGNDPEINENDDADIDFTNDSESEEMNECALDADAGSKVDTMEDEGLHSTIEDSDDNDGDDEMNIGVASQEQIQEKEHIEMRAPIAMSSFTAIPTRLSEELMISHYRKCLLEGMREVAQITDKLELHKECREEQESELELLLALKRGALQNSHTARKASKLSATIRKLQKAYSHNERELYKLKRERAIGDARVDRFASKINKVEYTDIYATCYSSYLSPIPEESEADLREYELGVFPSETNTSPAALAHRCGHLFLDVSTSTNFN